jgi:ethanolamine ammonia-lyase small subunit
VTDDAGETTDPGLTARERVADAWSTLRRYTPAHVGLGRAGVSLPTSVQLAFGVAHALARDAVHERLDAERLAGELRALSLEPSEVASAAADRATYLRRPDLGRRIDPTSGARLTTLAASQTDGCDVAFIVADGLSAPAAQRHAAPLLREVLERLRSSSPSWVVGPVVIAHQARVALGDPIGEALRASVAVVLIGERPGLSAPDSLGVYVTWDPRPGRLDAERNCLSNVRPEGLGYANAAARLVWLLAEIRARQRSGVSVKDDLDIVPSGRSPAFLLGRD